MKVLGLDFETSGLPDVGEIRVAEVGLTLFDFEKKKLLYSTGFLVDTGNIEWQAGASIVNLLSAEYCHDHGVGNEDALNTILNLMEKTDLMCTHNGSRFDRPILEKWASAYNKILPDKLWIDTYTDIPCKPQSLAALGGYHSFANLFPHSAEGDVHLMLRVLSQYDISPVLTHAESPKLILKAEAPYEQKEMLRDQFFWAFYQKDAFKFWRKDILASRLDKEAANAKELGYGLFKIHDPELKPIVSALGDKASVIAAKGAVGK